MMNFYIGNSIDEIDEKDANVEFSDDLINFVYRLSKQESFDMSKLIEINPYADFVVSKNDVNKIIEICNYIINKSLLETYNEPEEGNLMLGGLADIAHKAQSRNLGLVSIGD